MGSAGAAGSRKRHLDRILQGAVRVNTERPLARLAHSCIPVSGFTF